MCGIAGIYDRRGGKPDRAVLDRMTDRLAHRGPDARGIYEHEGVGFGHRRLSIIGLSDGLQPMCNEDGTVWVTYNGEIYNYGPLKRELEALGHTFKTHSDTEVLLHGYEAWGKELVHRLRGIYAFAIHHQRERQVFCVRDRLGVKPFYYHLDPARFMFASEAKSLLLHPDMPKRPNLEGVYLYLRYGYLPAQYTAFEGMLQLEPGSMLTISADSTQLERYWVPPEPGSRSPQNVDELIDRLVDETVDIELMSEVPLGAFLSGGVDSSIVAAAMARSKSLSSKPRTFCIGFPEPEYDESKYSRQVADQLGLDHQIEIIQKDDLELLDRLVEVYDEPFADSSAIPVYALCKMARKHVTVALSGDGGDEIFAGYRRYKKLASYTELPGAARKLVSTLVPFYPKGERGEHRLRRYAGTLGEQYDGDLSIFQAHQIGELTTLDEKSRPDWSIAALFEKAPGHTAVQKAQYTDLQSYLPGDILTKVDRASMAHALEVRVPLLDHVFVEQTLTLPESQTFGDGVGKVALKAHLGRRIPKEIFDRPKMGFGVPLEHWLGGDGGLEAIAKRLRSRHKTGGLHSPVKPEMLDAVIQRHKGGRDSSYQLWSLLFLETWWQRQFV